MPSQDCTPIWCTRNKRRLLQILLSRGCEEPVPVGVAVGATRTGLASQHLGTCQHFPLRGTSCDIVKSPRVIETQSPQPWCTRRHAEFVGSWRSGAAAGCGNASISRLSSVAALLNARPQERKPESYSWTMKVKAINRSEEACTRERSSDLRKVSACHLLQFWQHGPPENADSCLT